MVLLSFCIPTYQRAALLRETLGSILSQSKSVEIIVSDNCSSDSTKSYMEEISTDYPHIHYHRWPQPVECGQNLLQTVKLATGRYCWLMTDDDRLEPGAIHHVVALLETYEDLTGISVNVEGYDRLLKEKKKIRYSHHMRRSKHFQHVESCFQELGAWFGYWSAHIIHRDRWQKAFLRGGYESCLGYHHLYLLVSMLVKDPSWYFTTQKCVAYRADNESFSLDYGAYRRYEIDVMAYFKVGKHFFGEKHPAALHVRKLVLDKYLFWQLVTLKCHLVSPKILWQIFKLSWNHYGTFRGFWCKLLPLIMTPSRGILAIRWIYRRWLKHSP